MIFSRTVVLKSTVSCATTLMLRLRWYTSYFSIDAIQQHLTGRLCVEALDELDGCTLPATSRSMNAIFRSAVPRS